MYYKTIEAENKLTEFRKKLKSKNMIKIKATTETTISINMPQYITRGRGTPGFRKSQK